MKKLKCFFRYVCLIALFVVVGKSSVRAEDLLTISAEVEGITYQQYLVDDGTIYLFLPSNAAESGLEIAYEGNVDAVSEGELDTDNKIITVDMNQEDTMSLTVSCGEEADEQTVVIMKSNLPCMNITLKDVTLETINSGTKDQKYAGNSVSIYNPDDSSQNLSAEGVEIKGRGNSTWSLDKKPYQIKFSKKTSVLGMGKAKKWVLLANGYDITSSRNALMLSLAQELNMPFTSKGTWIDLFVDGAYLGNYFICEKVEVADNRVELSDEEGILVEMDWRYASEDYNFVTKITQKGFSCGEFVSDDESVRRTALSKFENAVNQFEELLYAEEKDWNAIEECIDVESFIYSFYIQEFCEDLDSFALSSFLYKDGESDVIHMGPVWDFDNSLGNLDSALLGGNPEIDYCADYSANYYTAISWFRELFKIPEFQEMAVQLYNDSIKDVLATANTKVNAYRQEISHSLDMNSILWEGLALDGREVGTYEEEFNRMTTWISKRVSYLNQRYLHNYVETIEDSRYVYTCTYCGDIYYEDCTTVGHRFINYISDGNATCETDGTKTAECTVCGTTDTVAEEGTELGHTFTDYVSDENATCEIDGTKTAKCTRCDATDTVTEEGTALGHTFTDYVSDENATCETDGTKTAKCTRCDATDTVTEEGTALGHTFIEYVSDGNATYESDGTKTAHCARCDAVDTITEEGSRLIQPETPSQQPTLVQQTTTVLPVVSAQTETSTSAVTDAAQASSEAETVVSEIKSSSASTAGTVHIETLSDKTKIIVDENGKRMKNQIVKIDGTKYITDKKGVVITSAFATTPEGKTVYANAKGAIVTDKVFTVDGKKYVAKKSGVIVTSAFTTTAKGYKVYSNKKGVVVTDKVFTVKGKQYVSTASGKIVTGKWVTKGTTKYYCNKKGVVTKTKTVALAAR